MENFSEKRIYNRLTALRAERGLSRHALAQALGMEYQALSSLEREDYSPDLDLAFRIGEFFGLPIEAIFSRQPFKPTTDEKYGYRL